MPADLSAKLTLNCPGCQKTLRMPATAAGMKAKCPACQTVFQTPSPVVVQPEEDDDFGLADVPVAPSSPATTFPDFSAAAVAKAPVQKSPGGFHMEKKGVERGVVGGLVMMVLAVVWFVAGLMFLDRIFFYPPILFIIGLFALIKGLATGNITGKPKQN